MVLRPFRVSRESWLGVQEAGRWVREEPPRRARQVRRGEGEVWWMEEEDDEEDEEEEGGGRRWSFKSRRRRPKE